MKKARVLMDAALVAALLMAYVPGAMDCAFALPDAPIALTAPTKDEPPLLLLTDGSDL